MLQSSHLAPFNKLEYLDKEIEQLKEEEKHLKWLKSLSPEEREWLIKQDFDKLLWRNVQTQMEARVYVKRCYVDIRNNVESMDVEALNMKVRFEQQPNEKKNPFQAEQGYT